jgi:hypothetical protein
MKYIITEDKLKKFLKRQFGIDLTGNIEMITSSLQIPRIFFYHFTTTDLNRYLNKYGPMYIIKIDKDGEMFLIQDRGDSELYIYSSRGYRINEVTFFERIGMEPIISVMDLIDQYYREEDYM